MRCRILATRTEPAALHTSWWTPERRESGFAAEWTSPATSALIWLWSCSTVYSRTPAKVMRVLGATRTDTGTGTLAGKDVTGAGNSFAIRQFDVSHLQSCWHQGGRRRDQLLRCRGREQRGLSCVVPLRERHQELGSLGNMNGASRLNLVGARGAWPPPGRRGSGMPCVSEAIWRLMQKRNRSKRCRRF